MVLRTRIKGTRTVRHHTWQRLQPWATVRNSGDPSEADGVLLCVVSDGAADVMVKWVV